MNDPEFHDPISDHAVAVENQHRDEEEEMMEEQLAFLAPSRWWFASTAFPLAAGTFGPMASAFSICALVSHWRQLLPPGTTEKTSSDFIDDPSWLVGINAAQLAIALISNLFLLLNMAKRVRFVIAQPVTIIGWYISAFTLIGLLATATGPLRIEDSTVDYAFAQGFYYAMFSAGLYFIVASLMVVTVWGAHKGHYKRDFELTMSQRTLMLQTISFMVYLLAGAAVYAHLENWNYLDAVYWADYTLLTVGIGNLAPKTATGRGLLFPFAIGGIIIIGLVIGSIRSLVLERGKVKMEARGVEKERERLLGRMVKKGQTNVLTPVDTVGQGDHTTSRRSSKTVLASEERDRRREEFELMRKVQKKAAETRRWVSLGVSGTTWLALWFAGAAVFQAAEVKTQDWSYFDSLYFSYVSLLTIGFGDIYPESNSGKAFFVFWSLLAVPSLTILISNMGDTIVRLIRDLTLWIGELTVLPNEKGLRAGIKQFLHKLTGGRAFEDDMHEQPPGLLGESRRQNQGGDSDNEENNDNRRKNDPDSAAQRAAGAHAEKDVEKAKDDSKDNDERAMPKSQLHYHVILIEEIGKVMKHLNSSPPRKYTYDEWAWYLKLVGEDESDPNNHRRAPKKPNPDAIVGAGATKEGHKWSWMGAKSPLMGNREEAEWVLEKLTKHLQEELLALRRKELEEGKDLESGDETEDRKEEERRKDKGMRYHDRGLKGAARLFDAQDGAGRANLMPP